MTSRNDNDAKKIVIDEAKTLSDKLTDGDSSNIELQGKAIALLVKMVTPLYRAEFVTIEECKIQHQQSEQNYKNNQNILDKERIQDRENEVTEFGIGSLRIKGRLNGLIISIVILAFGVVFAIGKTERWW